jgi:hypothetical protein
MRQYAVEHFADEQECYCKKKRRRKDRVSFVVTPVQSLQCRELPCQLYIVH